MTRRNFEVNAYQVLEIQTQSTLPGSLALYFAWIFSHYIYYCGQELLRRNGVAIIVIKSPKRSIWMQSQK